MTMMQQKRRRPRAGGVEEAEQALMVSEEALGAQGEWVGPGRCPRCPLEVGSLCEEDCVVIIPGV